MSRRGAAQFLLEVVRQMKLVAWPSSREVTQYAAVIGFTLLVLVAYLLVVDVAASGLVDRVTGR